MFKLTGVDVYLHSETLPDIPKEYGKLKLTFIANRGTRIWPGSATLTNLMDLMQCRYEASDDVTDSEVGALLAELAKSFTWSKSQKLYARDGEKLYSQPY